MQDVSCLVFMLNQGLSMVVFLLLRGVLGQEGRTASHEGTSGGSKPHEGHNMKRLLWYSSHYSSSVRSNRLWLGEILLLSALHNGNGNQQPLGQDALSIHSEAERTTSRETFSLSKENRYQSLAQPSTLFVERSEDNGCVCFLFIRFSMRGYFD